MLHAKFKDQRTSGSGEEDCLRFLPYMVREIWSSGFPTRSHTNHALQPHKMARGLKFCI